MMEELPMRVHPVIEAAAAKLGTGDDGEFAVDKLGTVAIDVGTGEMKLYALVYDGVQVQVEEILLIQDESLSTSGTGKKLADIVQVTVTVTNTPPTAAHALACMPQLRRKHTANLCRAKRSSECRHCPGRRG